MRIQAFQCGYQCGFWDSNENFRVSIWVRGEHCGLWDFIVGSGFHVCILRFQYVSWCSNVDLKIVDRGIVLWILNCNGIPCSFDVLFYCWIRRFGIRRFVFQCFVRNSNVDSKISDVDPGNSVWILGFQCGYCDFSVYPEISVGMQRFHCGPFDSIGDPEISVRILGIHFGFWESSMDSGIPV